MKAIIEDLIYDTEKADKIFEFRRKVQGAECVFKPGYYFFDWHEMKLYKTKKGRYFEYDTVNETIRVLNEIEVKEILSKLNIHKYIEIFGELEEA